MARMCEKTGAKVICSLEQTVYVLLNDKSRMKGDFQVRFREKFEVKGLLLTRLRGTPGNGCVYSTIKTLIFRCALLLLF